MANVHQILGYEVLATLGYGARSTIFAVRDQDNQIYALKRVVKQDSADQRFLDQAQREFEVASQLDHPSLRKSYKIYRERRLIRVSEIIVVMELVDGLTMEQYKARDLAHLCQICKDVAAGLRHMHERGFVHADIKPNNIMVTSQQQIKIIDFGQSCPSGTIKQRIQGTPDYIAPEQVKRKKISPQTDVFNLGATLYWLLTRQHVPTLMPRTGEPGSLLLRSNTTPRTPAEINSAVPPALSSLVMNCIENEPHDRPESMSMVEDRLSLAISQLQRKAASSDADDATGRIRAG